MCRHALGDPTLDLRLEAAWQLAIPTSVERNYSTRDCHEVTPTRIRIVGERRGK